MVVVGLRVLGIVTALLTNLCQQIVVIRFLNPKLHVRLVLEKWAWHIKTLPGNLPGNLPQPRISLQPRVRISSYSACILLPIIPILRRSFKNFTRFVDKFT